MSDCGRLDPAVLSAVRLNYGQVAQYYCSGWADRLVGHGRELLARLPLSTAKAVLDLGCGPGRLLPHLADQAPRAYVVGADATEAMLVLAPRRFARVVTDAQALPFGGEVFDVVTLAFVLQHLGDPRAGLSELRRVVRPGGAVGLLTWAAAPTPPAYDVWIDCVDDAGAPPDPRPMVFTVLDTADANAVAGALTKAGFADVQVEVHPFRWHPTAEQFVEHSVRIGVAARRLELLPPDARQVCIDAARERLRALPASAFLREASALHSVAQAPRARP